MSHQVRHAVLNGSQQLIAYFVMEFVKGCVFSIVGLFCDIC